MCPVGKNYMYVCVDPALLALSICHVYYLIILCILLSLPRTCLAREPHISYNLYTMKYSAPQTFNIQLEKHV